MHPKRWTLGLALLLLWAPLAWGQAPINAALSATVTVSSESVASEQLGSKAVDGIVDGWPGDYKKEWATAGQGAGAWIRLTWPAPVTIGQIFLYDRPNLDDQVLGGTLTFSDGSTLSVGPLPNNAAPLAIVVDPPKAVTWVQFTIAQARGPNIGLAEFQVFTPTVAAVPPPAMAPPTRDELIAALKEWDAFQLKFDTAFQALVLEYDTIAAKLRDLLKRSQP